VSSPETIRALRVIRGVSLVVLSAVAISSVAPAGEAYSAFHTHLKKSEPSANDTVTSPSAVKLWFSEKVTLAFTKVAVKNPAGVAQSVGAPAFADTSKDAAVVVPITGALQPGTYTVVWSAAADDGHPARGKFDFVVK
jgi:methionine-rich copper-binding protein CopC